MMWHGIFVCESCAKKHVEFFGGKSKAYPVSVGGDLWDSYQLRSVALGGNKNFFDTLKTNDLQKAEFEEKYSHKEVEFYKLKHVA